MINRRFFTAYGITALSFVLLELTTVLAIVQTQTAHADWHAARDLPIEDQQAVQLTMEQTLTDLAQHPFACYMGHLDCINGYERLLKVDWTTAHLPPGAMIIVGETSAPMTLHRMTIAFSATDEQLLTRLHAQAVNESPITLEQIVLRLNESTDSHRCTEETAQARLHAMSPTVCAGHSAFYDGLFAQDTFDVTMVKGYMDNPERTTAAGELTYPGFDAFSFHTQIEELVKAYGFTLKSQTSNEARLERIFFYRGHVKTARVHLVRSLVICPGEEGIAETYRNASSICPAQVAATRYAREVFAQSFRDSQLVIYQGHSRYGHGPDFGPVFSAAGRFPIAEGALAHTAIESARTVLFMNSCESVEHFTRAIEERQLQLRAHAQGMGWVGNTSVEYFANIPRTSNRLLVGLMQGECPAEIAAMIDLSRNWPEPSNSRVILQGM